MSTARLPCHDKSRHVHSAALPETTSAGDTSPTHIVSIRDHGSVDIFSMTRRHWGLFRSTPHLTACLIVCCKPFHTHTGELPNPSIMGNPISLPHPSPECKGEPPTTASLSCIFFHVRKASTPKEPFSCHAVSDFRSKGQVPRGHTPFCTHARA